MLISFINTSFNLCLEEAYGVLANVAPTLSRRLVEIGLDPKTKAYAATPAILGCMSILQEGVINRQNKLEMRKIRESIERLEGEPQAIDI